MRLATILAIALLACGCGRVRAYQAKATESCQFTHYRVQWRNAATGKSGHGEWQTDQALVAQWVADGNQHYPAIAHSMEARAGHSQTQCKPLAYPACQSGAFGGQECQ